MMEKRQGGAPASRGVLNALINLAKLSPTFGMVGPMSNYAAPPQLVEAMPYRMKLKQSKTPRRFGVTERLLETEAMRAFAADHREKNKGKCLEADRLGGFCVLPKREALDRIGLVNLEKWTDLSLFDSDILGTKVRQAGFTLACCRDRFVHHFGTRVFSHGAGERRHDAQ